MIAIIRHIRPRCLARTWERACSGVRLSGRTDAGNHGTKSWVKAEPSRSRATAIRHRRRAQRPAWLTRLACASVGFSCLVDPRDGTDRLARSRPWTSPLKPGIGRASPARDAVFLERFDARMRVPIIVSAILPLVVVPESSGWIGVVVGIVTWLVFLADYLIQARHLDHYGRIRLGRFDLFVVIATAPWFLLPGTQAGRFGAALMSGTLTGRAGAALPRAKCLQAGRYR